MSILDSLTGGGDDAQSNDTQSDGGAMEAPETSDGAPATPSADSAAAPADEVTPSSADEEKPAM